MSGSDDIVAVMDAVPGWHAVLVIPTGLRNAEENTDREFIKLLVIPIEKWGLRAPEPLRRFAQRKPGTHADVFGALGVSVALSLGIPRDRPPILPLDSRAKKPKLFNEKHLIGIFSPKEGSAQAVFNKAKAILKAEEQRLLLSEDEAEKRAEAARQAEDFVEVNVDDLKATAQRDPKAQRGTRVSASWACSYSWGHEESFYGTRNEVGSHMHAVIVSHQLEEKQ